MDENITSANGASLSIAIIGITGIGEITAGHDLGLTIYEKAMAQGTPVQDGDIIVVTQKAVSKSEGMIVDLDTITPSPFALGISKTLNKDPRLVEVVLREASRIVKMDNGVIITQTHHGFVCANSGVDASNVPGSSSVTLLPRDPDASAARIRARIQDLSGRRVAVIVSDTFGRPWRMGIVNVAIGVSGLEPIADLRGSADAFGKTLKATEIAVADEIASAAELVTGKTRGIPVVIVRGYPWSFSETGSSKSLIRPKESDLFR
ncbi:MAG TPA: coenzyme F420-0:L-glutamate ligase [Clostridia bacterium]|nr:coenzyme F420-0:L-glutamate ligase [Clostridia bacterium]